MLAVGFALTAVLAACEESPAESRDSSLQDAGTDAETAPDASSDVVADLGLDAELPEDASADTPQETDSATDADTGEDADSGTDSDAAPDAEPDLPPIETSRVNLPLGETLFLDGDDYLARWGGGEADQITLEGTPVGAGAVIIGGRLTPDVTGEWTLDFAGEEIVVDVRDDLLTTDTFTNFNYTPNVPLANAAGSLWAALPPTNAVYRVDNGDEGLEVVAIVPTGAWPTSIAWWESGQRLLISQAGRDCIGLLNPETERVEDAYWVGDEPATILVDGLVAYVALSGENAVVRLDLESGLVDARVEVGRDPRAMILGPDGLLYVASLMSSNVHPQGRATEDFVEDLDDISVIDPVTFDLVASVPAVATIIRGLFIDPENPDFLVAAVSHSNNRIAQVDADARPHTHGLEFIDLEVESDTRFTAVGSLDLDRQPSSSGPAASPFSIAVADEDHLLVTLSAGNAVLVLDRETLEEVDRISTGSDPRGLVATDNGFATLAWLDTRVEAFDWPGEAGTRETRTLSLPGDPTPDDVAEGRRMFNDASFSRHGDFSCNNCHIDGLTDGLVWNLLLDGDVNTISFRNVGGTGPFLWGGQLPTLFDFSREVLQLVGATATGGQMELLTRYMQSVTAPPNPHAGPGGAFTDVALRGRDVFAEVGCIGCHNGPAFTNRETVDGKTPGFQTDVPSLISTYDSGPWGRQAGWTTLEAMVEFAAVDYLGATVSEEDLVDLTAYVAQLPGDRLYLNSALPLDNETYVFFETELELVFSDSLTPGQVNAFSMHRIADTVEDVAGSWEVSGRYARFTPVEALERETRYEMRVRAGLQGALGAQSEQPIVVHFETGAEPLTDVSGTFSLTLDNPLIGTFSFPTSFLQTRGGKVTGVVSDDFEEGGIDHLEGSVSGTVLALDPFFVLTDFGNFPIPDGADLQTEDYDGDGLADFAEGIIVVEAFGGRFDVITTAIRTD
ncbi:MAG: DNA-binding beta-propeller fold protein YncE [Bradymonadia bacterium]